MLIMAQDTVVGWNNPRLHTGDATAEFTKTLVIHVLWLVTSIVFLLFTWYVRPTGTWRWQLALATIVTMWTVGVIVWASRDVERLTVATWSCTAAPTSTVVDDAFLDTCELTNSYSDIRMGQDIFLWSIDDKHHWRWIVPGQGRTTLQTAWPLDANGLYLAPDEPGAEFLHQSEDSSIGKRWSASFNPQIVTRLNLFYVNSEEPSDTPATPEAFSPQPRHARIRPEEA